MNKAYLTTLKVLAFILTFVLGMFSAFAILVGAGFYAAQNVSLNKLEGYGVKVDTSNLFNEQSAEKPIRDMTIVNFVKEAQEISQMADVTTFDTLTVKYGLITPAKGESDLFDAMRDIPFSILFKQDGLEEVMRRLQIGELMGFELRENPNYDPTDPYSREMIWYDPALEENVWAVEGIFCDYNIYDLIYTIEIDKAVEGVPIGDLLNFERIDGKWYDGDKLQTGIMAVISDRTVDNLGDVLDDTPMGDLLSYTFDEETGKWLDPGDSNNEVPPFMQLVANSKFSELDQLYDRITIADLVPESERQSGYISLVSPDTHLSEVSTEVNRVFAEATLQQLIDCGAIDITEEEQVSLDNKPELKEMTMKQMLSYILSVPSIPST